MNEIVLINGNRTGHPVLPVGLGYVAQALENAGFDCVVYDVNLLGADQIVQAVQALKPKCIGLGTMTHEVDKNYQLLGLLRAAVPGVPIVLGGPHAIAAQQEIFRECPAIDMVIQGEGEESLVKLCHGVPWQEIPGILNRDAPGEALPPEPLALDDIAFPRYHKFDLAKYGRAMPLASSRGCVYQCSFCGAPKFLGKKWRAFKVERMIQEFAHWYGNRYRQFYFSDSLFALDKKRVADFCAHITDKGYDDVIFTADGLRADHLTVEILQQLKKAHFTALALGVESVNEETLDFFKKGESFRQIDNAIAIADSLGFDISIYLIIGAPNESHDDAMKSIRYPLRYKNITHSIVSKLTAIKGTPYYEYALEHNLLEDTAVCYPELEAFGWNARQKASAQCGDSANRIEALWDSLYAAIENMAKFISRRNQVRKLLATLGLKRVDVKRLNLLTRISLIPALSGLLHASSRVVRSKKPERMEAQ